MVEVSVPRTDYELGIPKITLERQKRIEALEKIKEVAIEKKARLLKEGIEIKKEQEKAQKEFQLEQKKKSKKKKDLLKKIGSLTRIKPKGIRVNEAAKLRLLKQLIQKKKRPVAILRNIEDKIPPAFSEEHSIFGDKPRKPKPTFLGKGGLI